MNHLKKILPFLLLFWLVFSCKKTKQEEALQPATSVDASASAADSTEFESDTATIVDNPTEQDTVYEKISVPYTHQEKVTKVPLPQKKMPTITRDISIKNKPKITDIKNKPPILAPVEPTNPPLEEPKEEVEIRSADLVFTGIDTILYIDEAKIIDLYVKVGENDIAELKKTLAEKVEREQSVKKSAETEVHSVENLKVYNQLKISPHYDKAHLLIDPVFSETQIINDEKGNFWKWNIKAIGEKEVKVKLTFVVESINTENLKNEIETKIFDIKIKIREKPFATKAYDFVDKHFNIILTAVIIPVFLGLFRLFRKRKQTAKEEESTDEV